MRQPHLHTNSLNSHMTTRRFFLLLGATSVISLLLSWIFQAVFPPLRLYNGVTLGSLFVFIPLNIILFFLGKYAASSPNKYLFTSGIMPFTFIKMFLAVVLLLVYKNIWQPETKYFVLPFFTTYICFIIFETYTMVKLAKPNN